MGLCWMLQHEGAQLCATRGFRDSLACPPESCMDRAQPTAGNLKAQKAVVRIGFWGRTYSLPGMKLAPLWVFPATIHLSCRPAMLGSGSATWVRGPSLPEPQCPRG